MAPLTGRDREDVKPLVSVVVPSLHRDLPHLDALLSQLRAEEGVEVLVVLPRDEQPHLDSLREASSWIRWLAAPRGRGSQMNAGAADARGEWLLFVHADCRLSAGWLSAIQEASAHPAVVGGCFRFALDSADLRARIIEMGVRLRVALLALPYGDQGLFVRRDTFHAIGGFADITLMEDVDFVRRLTRHGRLFRARVPLVTSARRWEHDGWIRRSARNLWLLTRYFCGASPARLAHRYNRPGLITIAMMARAPGTPGKRRLEALTTPADHVALQAALFDDTLEIVGQMLNVHRVIVCEPAHACDALRARVGPTADVVPQGEGDVGMRMEAAFRELLTRGTSGVILLGSDVPDLPRQTLQTAVDALSRPGDRVVLGPARDGGYYLIGLKAPHPQLFEHVNWGTPAVLSQTLERITQAGLDVEQLPPWSDVDTLDDLRRLLVSETAGAARTRAWLDARRALFEQRPSADVPVSQRLMRP